MVGRVWKKGKYGFHHVVCGSRFGAYVLELWWLTDRLDDERFKNCYRDPPRHALLTTSLVYVGPRIIGATQSRT